MKHLSAFAAAIAPSSSKTSHFGVSCSVCHVTCRRRARPARLRSSAPAPDALGQSDEGLPAGLEERIRDYVASNGGAASAAPSPLSYLTLYRAKRMDLVEPIMNAGGYISVSGRLGLPVDGAFLEYKPPLTFEEIPSVFTRVDDGSTGPAVSLGFRKEERLAETTFSKFTRTLDGDRDGSILKQFAGPEPVPSAEEIAEIGKSIVIVKDKAVPEGERLTMDVSMRAGMILMVASTVLGFGHATNSPAGIALLSPPVVSAAQSIACGLSVIHFFLAGYTAFSLAPSLERNAPLWAFKVILAGPSGVVALRKLGMREERDAEQAR
jgi:hypothetical protein